MRDEYDFSEGRRNVYAALYAQEGRTMTVTATQVRELRERTHAPLLACRDALVSVGGDLDSAVDYLRRAGIEASQRRSGRVATEGLVESYVHAGRIAVIVEVNCETDFVARTDAFQTLVREIAMQIAASDPICVSADEVPEQMLARERSVKEAQLRESKGSKLPEKMVPQILDGQIEKWLRTVCLLEQTYNRDRDKTIQDLVNEVAAATGEKIEVRRFVRYELGEGRELPQNPMRAETSGTIES
jgi:elongation factor Ts